MSTRSLEALVWFGALGGAAAWTVQLVAGAELEENHCTRAGLRYSIHTPTWEAALTAVCAAVAIAAGVAALLAYRRTRHGGDRRGRIGFMATSGMLANVLFLALILLGGIGASVLDPCVQG
jgi:hypothetical protein